MGITPEQLARMVERLQRPRRRPEPAIPTVAPAPRPAAGSAVLGIDPSLRGTGYGVVRVTAARPVVVAQGTIKCPAGWPVTRCLGHIAASLRETIQAHRPTVCVVEGLFYAQNLQTALIMGQARGAGLAVAAEAGLEVYEIAPRKVKQAIVGYGAARKEAVARMVQRMLALPEPPAPDAADALALALTWLQESRRFALAGPKRI